MNLDNRYKFTNWIILQKLCFSETSIFYLSIEVKGSIVFLLIEFLQSMLWENCFWPKTKKIVDAIENTTMKVK